MKKCTILILLLVLCLGYSAQADIMYTGTYSLKDGLVGFGNDLIGRDVTFEWEVSRDPSGDPSGPPYDPWHYKYTLSFNPEVAHAISHVAFEVSNPFDSIFNLQVTPRTYYVGDPPDAGAEPTSQDWVLGELYAIKFDSVQGVDVTDSLTIEFDSMRVPEWGDFNAKGGNVDDNGDGGWYVYNSGYSTSDDDDPIFDPLNQLGLPTLHTNGDIEWTTGYMGHIVVPDTQVVPVPGAVLLGMIGLSAAGIKLRKHA